MEASPSPAYGARLLSGLRVKPLAGSNPAASATLTRAFALLEIANLLHSLRKQRYSCLTPAEVRGRMSEAFAVRLLDAASQQLSDPAVRFHDGSVLLTGGVVGASEDVKSEVAASF